MTSSSKTLNYPADPDLISLDLNDKKEFGSKDVFDVTSSDFQMKKLRWKVKHLQELLAEKSKPRWHLTPLKIPTIVSIALCQLFVILWCFLAGEVITSQYQLSQQAESLTESRR